MANISHASLTGAQLHEPKGADTAALGTVYVSNGAGSGSWNNIGTSSFTGMVADFAAPVAPLGWLELDGSIISSTTYSALYSVMTVGITGTRTNGSPVITSIASTTNLRVGYYVFGTGITSGTTIISIDSGTQVTLSNNAVSSGTAAITISPWLLNTGTIQLPDATTAGRYRRSRSSTTAVGQIQADQNQAHTHTVSGTTNSTGDHVHANTVSDPGHTHILGGTGVSSLKVNNAGNAGSLFNSIQFNNGTDGTVAILNATTNISVTDSTAGAHSHTVSGTAASVGGTEARPLSLVFLTCVKT